MVGVGICMKCGKEKIVASSGKSKGFCHVCYKRYLWKPKSKICKRCNRSLPHHARGFCVGCYNSLFHIDKVKMHNAKRRYKIDSELFKKLTKQCLICKFDKLVEIHHLDHNNKNNSEKNLVSLCPNCHKLIHTTKYQKEIFDVLREKGYSVPEGYKMDGFFRIMRKNNPSHNFD